MTDVSVIIPAYNAEKTLARAINSAALQQGVSVEVIVVDDASPRVQETSVNLDSNTNIQFIRLAENGGPSAARNAALEKASGRYIAVLDADDYYLEGRLQTMVALADELSSDILVDNLRLDFLGRENRASELLIDVDDLTFPLKIDLQTYIDTHEDNKLGKHLGYLKPLFRRAVFEKLAISYDESLRISEDFYLVAEMLARGCNMFLSDHNGYSYSIHDQSLSHRLSTAQARAILDKEISFQSQFRSLALSSSELKRVFQRRKRHFVQQYVNEGVINSLRNRDIKSLGSIFFSHPSAWPGLAAKLGSIMTRKAQNKDEVRFH